jgi:hypothetical protein
MISNPMREVNPTKGFKAGLTVVDISMMDEKQRIKNL